MSALKTTSRLPHPSRPKPVAGPAALYQQVREYLQKKISSREWVAGDRVSSEQELVTLFGVSRMTVNRALRELSEQGVVTRIAGVGTFVAEDRPRSTLLQIAIIGQEIRQRGHDYRFKVLAVRRVPASSEVAAMLGIRQGQSIAQAQCIHYENDVPVQLEDRFVNPLTAPEFASQTFDTEAPGEYLLRTVPADEVEHVVDATLPTKKQAHLLDMEEDQPCLVLIRRTWTAGQAVTYVHCIHPAARYRLGSRFRINGTIG